MTDISDAFKELEKQEQPGGEGGEPKGKTPETPETPEQPGGEEPQETPKPPETQKGETPKSGEDPKGDPEAPASEDPKGEKKSIEELTEGKYKSEEELYKAFKEAQEKTSEYEKFKEEAIVPTSYAKKVHELEKKGLKVTPKLLSELEVKWDEMDTKKREDALRMVEMQMRIDKPDFDDEDIKYLMDKKYGYDEESRREQLSEKHEDEKVEEIIKREKEDMLRGLSIEAKSALPKLKEYQSSLTEVGDGGKKAEEDKNLYLTDLSESMGKLENVTFKVGDEDVSVPVSKEAKEGISETLESLVTNPEAFWQKIGQLPGFAEKLAIAMNIDSIIKEVGKRSNAKAREQEANGLTNQNPYGSKNPSGGESDSEVEDAKNYARSMGVPV